MLFFSCLVLFQGLFVCSKPLFFSHISTYRSVPIDGKRLVKTKGVVTHFGVSAAVICFKPRQEDYQVLIPHCFTSPQVCSPGAEKIIWELVTQAFDLCLLSSHNFSNIIMRIKAASQRTG